MNKEELLKGVKNSLNYCLKHELVTWEEINEMRANGQQVKLSAHLITIAKLHKKAHPEAK